MTNVPLMYLIGIFALDSKTFGKLRPEDQVVVREEIGSAAERLDVATREGDLSAIEALQNKGIEFVLPSSQEEVERWHHISVEAMQRLRGLDRYSGSLIDEMIEHVEAYRARLSPGSPMVEAQREPTGPGVGTQ